MDLERLETRQGIARLTTPLLYAAASQPCIHRLIFLLDSRVQHLQFSEAASPGRVRRLYSFCPPPMRERHRRTGADHFDARNTFSPRRPTG